MNIDTWLLVFIKYNLGSQIDLALLAIRLYSKCGREIYFASGFK
jgi:hypothetical protein